MPETALRGVIAAIATPIDQTGEPDCARATKLARYLLDNGCDGLNVLGTTGEATSFSVAQRTALMTAYRDAGMPMTRLMVGTGAAAISDAISLTRHASELGFGGALLLPPFYYKGVSDEGLFAYVEGIVTATASRPIPIYLYHFPAQSGLPWHPALIRRLLDSFGTRLAGLKDSSGDMAYARDVASIAASFQVFPSTEAVLLEARTGRFAGCISATANLNADLCALAWRSNSSHALDRAVAIRNLFDPKRLVPGVKAVLAHIHADPNWAKLQPPLSPCSTGEASALASNYNRLRAESAQLPMAQIQAASG